MFLIMEGQGRLITRMPLSPQGSSLPASSTTAAAMPGKASVQEPGTRSVAPGSGVIMCPPVSVCQNVSTMGQRPPPTCSWYQCQAAGLIGSPTDPRRSEEHTSELQSQSNLVCRLLLEKKKKI